MFSIAPYRVVVTLEHRTVRLWTDDMAGGFMPWVTAQLEQRLGRIVERGELGRSRLSRLALNADGTVMAGIIQTGDLGFTAQLYDVAEHHVSHERTIREAELIPFFFLLACPPGVDFGVLLLQRFKNYGVRDYFADPLVEAFTANEGEKAVVSFNRLVPQTLAMQLLNDGMVKVVRLVSYELPDDLSDSFGEGYQTAVRQVELVIRAKRDGFLPKIPGFSQVLGGNRNVDQVFAVESFQYDTIKLELEVAGRRRLVNLGRPTTMSPNFDVTDELVTGGDGHPTWDSCVEVFSEHARGLLEDGGYANPIDFDFVVDTKAPDLPLAAEMDPLAAD